MINLINANFAKLFKTVVFKIGMAFMAFMPAFVVLVSLAEKGKHSDMNGIFNVGFMFMGIVIPILVSLFLGQDYSDNFIRNKLAAGHSRLKIYISGLIVSFCAGVILQITCIASGCLFSIPFFGLFSQPLKDIVSIQLLGLCLIAVYTALTTFITMLMTNKTHAVVVAMLTSMTIFMAGMGAYQYVTERKALSEKEPAQVVREDSLPYILYETVPSSQACILSEGGVPDNSMKILGYDVLSTSVLTLLGLVLYRKKDFK